MKIIKADCFDRTGGWVVLNDYNLRVGRLTYTRRSGWTAYRACCGLQVHNQPNNWNWTFSSKKEAGEALCRATHCTNARCQGADDFSYGGCRCRTCNPSAHLALLAKQERETARRNELSARTVNGVLLTLAANDVRLKMTSDELDVFISEALEKLGRTIKWKACDNK